MKFYNETKPLYLETDASGIGLGAALLQTRDSTTCPKGIVPDNTILRPITFASKSLTSAEYRYSNIEREALGILHCLEKFHHYCFPREVNVIKGHNSLVAIFKKGIATLSQQIQCILLRRHQYRVRILYKLGSEIFIVYWLSRQNHMGNKDTAICGLDIRVDAIQASTNVPECMSAQQILQATAQDKHLNQLKGFIMGRLQVGPSVLAAFQSGSSQKENWRASDSMFSPSGNTMESLCCSSFHMCSWWSQPQAFTLCTLSVIVLMCLLSDRGTCNMVSLMQMNVYGQSGPLSTNSINFQAASTRVDKWPWWGCAHTTARLKTWSPPALVLGTIIWKAISHLGFLTSPQAPAWERVVNWVCMIACTWNHISMGQKSRDPQAALVVGSHRMASPTGMRTHS